MPTYDYKCNSCDKVFEHFQSIKDEPLSKCICEKQGDVTKLISSGTGIIFKGSGFYVNDYKKPSASAAGSSDSPSTTS
jgi:putative FmdB family regulatory protein